MTAQPQRWDAVMMPNYGTPPIALDHGQGVRVWDADGNAYLDFVGGIAVSSLGHAHPAIVDAVSRQVAKLAHTSNLAMHEPGLQLAERLRRPARRLPGARLLRQQRRRGQRVRAQARPPARPRPSGRAEIVACHDSFHGRTLGALSVTGNEAKRAPFEPLPGPGHLRRLRRRRRTARARSDRQTAAVFVEPTLGEGGVVPPPAGFLADVRRICDAAGALLVVDEVQSGIGRTGHWFASQAEGVRPDIITLAKGLGGGLPIGACIGFGAAGELFSPGDHGSTFGGNPVSCAAALAVLATIADDHLLDNVKRVGEHLAPALDELDSPLVAEVRGSGLWRGLVLTGDRAGRRRGRGPRRAACSSTPSSRTRSGSRRR